MSLLRDIYLENIIKDYIEQKCDGCNKNKNITFKLCKDCETMKDC